MTNEQLADMGRQVAQLHYSTIEIWQLAVRIMPTHSSEYRAICKMGEQVQDVYHMLRVEAEEKGWTQAQINQVFGLNNESTFI